VIDLIRELFQYQSWADLQIVAAAKPYADDAELRKTLHHMVFVQRYFLLQCSGGEFDPELEMRPPTPLKSSNNSSVTPTPTKSSS
jgi:uncharacterized damage-inducible protein DinB